MDRIGAAVWATVCGGVDTCAGAGDVMRAMVTTMAIMISPIHKTPRWADPCGAPGSDGGSAAVRMGASRCDFSKWV